MFLNLKKKTKTWQVDKWGVAKGSVYDSDMDLVQRQFQLFLFMLYHMLINFRAISILKLDSEFNIKFIFYNIITQISHPHIKNQMYAA